MVQSALSIFPIGVPLFWEKNPPPTKTWEKVFTTPKLSSSAKKMYKSNEFYVQDQQLQICTTQRNQSTSQHFYTRHRQKIAKENRGTSKRSRLEKICQTVDDQGPMIDNFRLVEIDNKSQKFKIALIRNRSHQRNPHTELSKCTTDALVIHIKETFKNIRNDTFDRFQFFRCT